MFHKPMEKNFTKCAYILLAVNIVAIQHPLMQYAVMQGHEGERYKIRFKFLREQAMIDSLLD